MWNLIRPSGLVTVFAALSVHACAQLPQSSNEERPPNIILILADDAGYADFGFHGSPDFLTPNLDAFAAQSVLFQQAYVTAAVCGPSRAGLLTGRYQQEFGYEENNVPGYMSLSGKFTGHEMGLPLDQVTMAQRLSNLGYRTGLIGKWHQGNADQFHPLKRGFDEFIGFRGGARSYYAYADDHFSSRPEDRWEHGFGVFQEPEGYLTDVMGAEAKAFIQRNQDQPFFLFLSLTAVHTPMEAKPEDLARFPDLKGKRKTLAAMGLAMDRAIGDVLTELDARGLSENSLVVFTNDNGGPSDTNVSNNTPLSGTKANHLEGGIRVPMLIRWPERLEAGARYGHPVSTLDLLPTFLAAAGGDGSLPELDGVDLLPFLSAQSSNRPHDTLYWKKENRAAIRSGDWKLLRFPDRPAELYDLSKDLSETQNLAREHPELVSHLYEKLFEWELTLERPLWMLRREYEGLAMDRMDTYRASPAD